VPDLIRLVTGILLVTGIFGMTYKRRPRARARIGFPGTTFPR
jgi:hypothetical protein